MTNQRGPYGYCIKCKVNTEYGSWERTETRNGRPAVTGDCAACGTTMYSLGQPKFTLPHTPPPPTNSRRDDGIRMSSRMT